MNQPTTLNDGDLPELDDIPFYAEQVMFWGGYSLELLRLKRVMWADAFRGVKYLQQAEKALEWSLFYRQQAYRERVEQQAASEPYVLTNELLVNYAMNSANCALADLHQVGIARNAWLCWQDQCESFDSFAVEILRRRRAELSHA